MAPDTPFLGLARPDAGASDWDVPVNDNFTVIEQTVNSLASSAGSAVSVTLNTPTEGDTGWDVPVNDNFATIEQAVGQLAQETGVSVTLGYTQPATGSSDWDVPLNANFGLIDGDLEDLSQAINVPTASFTFSPSDPFEDETVTFDASASSAPAGIASYDWTMGDGTVLTGQTVTHSYATAGTFTVTLTVTDTDGQTDSVQMDVTVSVDQPPTASFTFTPTSPTVGSPVSFDGTGSSDPEGAIQSYSWDMGDGSVLSGPTVSHTYSVTGTFTVTLTVTDSAGQTDSVSQDVVVSEDQPPTASFTWTPTDPAVGEEVTFDGSASFDPEGEITSYHWLTSDGGGAEGPNRDTFLHTFTAAGTYTVTLTVTDSAGQTDSVSQDITVGDLSPTASFTFSPTDPLAGETVTFDGTGSGDPDGTIQSYDWSMGDGTVQSGSIVSHAYATSGTYTVTLTVTDDAGNTDSVQQDIVVGSDTAPTASFTYSPTSPVPGESITFDGTGSTDPEGAIQSYSWDMGDGTVLTGSTVTHSYAVTGTFTVTLTVTDSAGQTGSTSQDVVVAEDQPPTASFTWSPTNPAVGESTTFDGGGSSDPEGEITNYDWLVRDPDGVTIGGQSGPNADTFTFTFSAAGTYTITLTVTDDAGQTDSLSQTITVGSGDSAPTASFTFSPTSPTSDDIITFDGGGSSDPEGAIASYDWDMGDGTVLTGSIVDHSYATSGTYTVTLTVTDSVGQTDSTSQSVSVSDPTVDESPTASFTYSPTTPLVNESITFDGTGSSDPEGAIASYSWDMGDGTVLAGSTVTHSYAAAGSYLVTLTVTDSAGQTGSTSQEVTVGEQLTGQLFHSTEIDFVGPQATETDTSPNPFFDYRMDVTFTGPNGETITRPGFFAGDGLGGPSGSVWRVRFTPTSTGTWTFDVSFVSGPDVATDPLNSGTPVDPDGRIGEVVVDPSDKAEPDFRAPTRGIVTNDPRGHYFRFSGSGAPFVKCGMNIPENFLGYAGFDNLPNATKTYDAHSIHWNTGDPDWNGGAGQNIVGAINYISQQGANVQYFLVNNVNGDGDDVWPHTGKFDAENYDVSKLRQWNILFEHMNAQGVMCHFVFAETETGNETYYDNGSLGPQRRIYFREHIARFGHLPALEWNIGEENDFTTTQRQNMMTYLKRVQGYNHPVTSHTKHTITDIENHYDPLLGFVDMDLTAFQPGDATNVPILRQYRAESAAAGAPWIISCDEPDMNNDPNDTTSGWPHGRVDWMWPAFMAGSGGFEWYLRTAGGSHGLDQALEDYTQLSDIILWSGYASTFMSQLPLGRMDPNPTLLGSSEWAMSTGIDDVHAIYLPTGTPETITLPSGTYNLEWFDPTTGTFFTAVQISGGSNVSLPNPPFSGDAAAIITQV